MQGLGRFPAGTYVVELVDEDTGQSWGKSAPLPIPLSDPSGQLPTVIFAHFDDQVGSWYVDPTTQDSDPATDEITVTNLIHEDVVVQRCLMTAAGPTSCTSVGTVSPGADLLTVETLTTSSPTSATPTSSCSDCYALFVQLASDASQSYERDLVQGSGTFGAEELPDRADPGPRQASAPVGLQPDRLHRVRHVLLLRVREQTLNRGSGDPGTRLAPLETGGPRRSARRRRFPSRDAD